MEKFSKELADLSELYESTKDAVNALSYSPGYTPKTMAGLQNMRSIAASFMKLYYQNCIDVKLFTMLSVTRAAEGFNTWNNVPLTYWSTALAGEVGELCNMITKMERMRSGGIDGGNSYTAASITPEMLEEEIGGIFIYLCLMASRLSIDLRQAAIKTFNKKSQQLQLPFKYED